LKKQRKSLTFVAAVDQMWFVLKIVYLKTLTINIMFQARTSWLVYCTCA